MDIRILSKIRKRYIWYYCLGEWTLIDKRWKTVHHLSEFKIKSRILTGHGYSWNKEYRKAVKYHNNLIVKQKEIAKGVRNKRWYDRIFQIKANELMYRNFKDLNLSEKQSYTNLLLELNILELQLKVPLTKVPLTK